MSVDFNGFNQNICTFSISGTVSSGIPVKLSANGTVSACSVGETFAGIASSVRSGYAGIQLTGYTEVAYTGTAPSVGYNTLGADGSGGVKTVSSGGRSILVVNVNTTSSTVGIIL